MRISEISRTVAFRLTLFYSLFFAACVIMLLGFVYWRTATEMVRRVDQKLMVEKTRFAAVEPDRVADEIHTSIHRDLRNAYFYGLFSSDGRSIAGNVLELPPIAADGGIHEIVLPPSATTELTKSLRARVLEIRDASGNVLLIGHDLQQLIEFDAIMKDAFFWGGTLTILLGLMFGLALSFRPLRRVEQIRQACELIVHGNLKERLPVGNYHDELDMLASIVNRMLDDIERLMSEIKSAGDNIAHDLRTPLTRLRAVLYRLQQQMGEAPAQRAMVDQVISEVDGLLSRFRALLRISEIENKHRRAGFKLVNLHEILEQAVNFFEPLAEDRSISLTMSAEDVEPVHGDGELLFEAISNLLDNAIKFTPAGGKVEVRLSHGGGRAQIDVVDSGCGIKESERAAVLNRFYRVGQDRQVPGHGLGLSLVMAILNLHDFGFALGDAAPGTRATISCWPQSA